jgi:NAD(P)-dependent dehydrogenase (short-subunit alcohol dehydrogenase family)
MTEPGKIEEHLADIPLDRYGDVDEIADAAAYLRDASYVTGETLRVDGGVTLG